MHLARAGQELTLDARPSDGIALALRAGAPIFVRRSVLEKARLQGEGVQISQDLSGQDAEVDDETPPPKIGWTM